MTFTSSVAPKICSRLLLSSAVLPMFLASSAFAQSEPQAPAAGETVVVTGSLIARPDYNTATPTVSVTSDSLKQSGQIALDAGLKDLPQFSTSTGGSGSFIGGSGQRNLSLRGLGPQRDLVLLDGRRLLPSSSDGTVDINQLPAAIVGNVEVITGGASAVYGSDAVSGVVNFKTKRPTDGLDISASYGTTEAYGGSQWDVNALGGINTPDGKGNLTFAVEYTRVTHVNWGTIPFYQQAQNGVTPIVQGVYLPGSNPPSQAAVNAYFAKYGAPAGVVPAAANAGFGFNADGTLFDVGPITGRPVYNYQALTDANGRLLNNVYAPPGQSLSVRNRSYYFRGTQNPLERWSSFVKGDWALTNSIHFFGQALYTNYNSTVQSDATVTSATQVPTIPVTNPFIPSDLAGLLATRANPTAPFSLSKRFLGIGGYRTATNANNVYQFIAGLNGVLGDTMTWDVYASHGQTLNTYSSTGAVRFSAIQQLLNAPDGGRSICAGGFNPFGNIQSSAACTSFASPEFTNRTNLTQDVLNADIQGTVFTLPAGDVKFALGADYRNISFQFKPDAAVQTGDPFTFNPQAPTQGASAVREVFGEALIPIVKDVPFFQNLNLDVAARYSDYVLSGGTNTYKGDIDWEVVNGFRLRGGYERAVRAPSVNELFSGNSTYYANRTPSGSGAGDPCDTRLRGSNPALLALCAASGLPAALLPTYSTNDNQVPAIASGTTTLRPEKADTMTAGMVYQPEIDSPWFQNASISVDYYNIRLRDAIAQLDFNTVVNKCYNLDGTNPSYSNSNFFCQLLGTRSQTNGQMVNVSTPYANTGGYKTSGIDIEANWVTDIGEATGWGSDAGTMSWDIVANYLNSFKQQILPGAPWVELGQTDIGGFVNSTATLGPFPKYQTNTRVTYHNFGADLSLRWRMIGGMRDACVTTNNCGALGVPGQGVANYFDATIGYSLPTTDTRFSLVINNLFDRTPSQVGANPGNTNSALYPVLGRTYLLTVDQKF
ncbi:MAG TPA: TonB-dependent receptor [Rhizomicrobium sp.]|jgi:outer membrane receptor protein involved in Fe transport